jgi:tetratricopeptide (TPR) repeat protein
MRREKLKMNIRRLGLSFFFPAFLAALLTAQTEQAVIHHVASALRANQFDDALRLLKPALLEFPHDPQLWALQGMAFAGAKNVSQALTAYRHALSISPDYLPALEGAAQIEYERGDKDASSLLRRIVKLRPDDQTSHAMLGSIAHQAGNCPAAIEEFSQSEKLLDSQPLSLQQYGFCLEKLGQFEKAISVLRHLLEIHPDDSRILAKIATLQLKADHPQDAIITLQPLLKDRPTTPISELAAAAYEAGGNTGTAVSILKQAMAQDPESINLYIDFAAIAFDHGSYPAGIAMMNLGIDAHPNAAPLYLERGILYVQIADYTKAEADFDKASQLDPHQSLSGVAQGKVAEQFGDYVKALATVQAKLVRHPNDPFLLYTKSEILLQKGVHPETREFQEAVESASKAIALQPGLTLARDALGGLYLEEGKFQLSAEQSRKALESDPKDQTALYHLILVLRRTKENTELPGLLKRLAELRQEATKATAVQDRENQTTPPVN